MNKCNINEIEVCDEYGAIFDSTHKSLIRFTHYPISKEYKIPQGTLIIENEAFNGNLVIEKIILPQSLISIGEKAFYNCPNLREVATEDMPCQKRGGLIGNYAFALCTSLQSIQLPDGFEYIGAYAFGGCQNLSVLFLPQSTIYIGESCFVNTLINDIELPINLLKLAPNCFKGCSVLDRITSKSPQYLIHKNELLQVPSEDQIYEEITLNSFIPFDKSPFYTVSNNVKIIGTSAFNSCQLQAVIVPEGVMRIESKAFWGCKHLKFIQLPSTLVFIADDAFSEELHSDLIYSDDSESWINSLSSIEGIKVPNNFSVKMQSMLPDLSDKIFESNENVSTIEEFCSLTRKYLHTMSANFNQKDPCTLNIDNVLDDTPTFVSYNGSYAQDIMGYSDDDIDIIFDGDPNAYWNID